MTRYAISLALCVTLLCGCKAVEYVPVERVVTRTDTIYSAKFRVDSVMLRDSVSLIQRGDTVFVTKYRERYKIKERIDTVYQSMIDSVKVCVPYPGERKLSRWEQAKMDYGGEAIVAVAIIVIAAGAWLIKKFRR